MVVLDGPINVAGGYITGSVVALNGPIRITGASLIGGDVLGGEKVGVEAGAKVGGQIRQNVGFTLQGPLGALGILVGGAAIAFSVLLLGLLLLLLAPRGADRVATAVRTAPLASFGWGLLLAIGLPLVCVALMVSIVGLPLGLTLLLALSLLFLAGLAWSAWVLGRLLVKPPRSRWLALLAGWAIVALLGLVPFLNLVVWGLASVLGIGAALVAIWRARGSARGGRHRVGGLIPEAPLVVPEVPPKAIAVGGGRPPRPESGARADLPLHLRRLTQPLRRPMAEMIPATTPATTPNATAPFRSRSTFAPSSTTAPGASNAPTKPPWPTRALPSDTIDWVRPRSIVTSPAARIGPQSAVCSSTSPPAAVAPPRRS